MMLTIENILQFHTLYMRGGSKNNKRYTHIQYISKPLRGFHKNIIRGTQILLQFLRAVENMQ